MPISPWKIADTGVRSAYRLKDGLRVIVNSRFHGNLTKENESGIAHLLASEGVVSLASNTDNTIARKWRLNLIRLGFISQQSHRITSNGQRLLDSTSLIAEEECFLRSLLAHQIPSELHNFTNEDIVPFSPLRMVLEVISSLGENDSAPEITEVELASIVINYYNMNQIPMIVDDIINYRRRRDLSDNRSRFDVDFMERASEEHDTIKVGSRKDYADANIRYFKATGLFAEDGKKLSVAIHKEIIFNEILSQPYTPISEEEYINVIEEGARLPTDNENESIINIRNIHRLLVDNEQNPLDLPDLNILSIQDLEQIRIGLENDWLHVLEGRFAEEQTNQGEDILRYLNALQNPRANTRIIPRGEAPVYLEWTIWRAFLAMNFLENEPWESRRFSIDRNFSPVRHAPGGGADMIFEYNDFVIVMEVTLTTSSRQEAAEGEPVRRHVAQYVDQYEQKGKRVYGVFIANNINTNTAETFRIGVWYRTDDSVMNLQIVPISLVEFTNLFEAIYNAEMASQSVPFIKRLLDEILSYGNESAPIWKRRVSDIIDRETSLIS